ncbi:MAG TPA: RodZ domain-containing protein [Vicinamibacterales bacterium]|nr:RodZ domain-containing protein [Vicinamibacterales bacterium]
MTDFGGKLRQARERRGISLREIAASTKISVTALEALERNDISKLPGGIFSRSFVRSYAAEVGLDPDETVREFLERFHAEPGGGASQGHAHDEALDFERDRRRQAGVFIIAVVVMIVLSAAVLYFVMKLRPGAEPVVPAVQQEAPAAPVASDPDPAAAAEPRTEPAPEAPPGEGLRLDLHPTGDCWVSVTADGRKVLERVVKGGERERLAAREWAVLTVGDAGACAFSINGRAARPLGNAGEVKTARITRDTIDQYVR